MPSPGALEGINFDVMNEFHSFVPVESLTSSPRSSTGSASVLEWTSNSDPEIMSLASLTPRSPSPLSVTALSTTGPSATSDNECQEDGEGHTLDNPTFDSPLVAPATELSDTPTKSATSSATQEALVASDVYHTPLSSLVERMSLQDSIIQWQTKSAHVSPIRSTGLGSPQEFNTAGQDDSILVTDSTDRSTEATSTPLAATAQSVMASSLFLPPRPSSRASSTSTVPLRLTQPMSILEYFEQKAQRADRPAEVQQEQDLPSRPSSAHSNLSYVSTTPEHRAVDLNDRPSRSPVWSRCSSPVYTRPPANLVSDFPPANSLNGPSHPRFVPYTRNDPGSPGSVNWDITLPCPNLLPPPQLNDPFDMSDQMAWCTPLLPAHNEPTLYSQFSKTSPNSLARERQSPPPLPPVPTPCLPLRTSCFPPPMLPQAPKQPASKKTVRIEEEIGTPPHTIGHVPSWLNLGIQSGVPSRDSSPDYTGAPGDCSVSSSWSNNWAHEQKIPRICPMQSRRSNASSPFVPPPDSPASSNSCFDSPRLPVLSEPMNPIGRMRARGATANNNHASRYMAPPTLGKSHTPRALPVPKPTGYEPFIPCYSPQVPPPRFCEDIYSRHQRFTPLPLVTPYDRPPLPLPTMPTSAPSNGLPPYSSMIPPVSCYPPRPRYMRPTPGGMPTFHQPPTFPPPSVPTPMTMPFFPGPPPIPHPVYWFSDGTIIFQVENMLYKVHRYFFERHSEQFRKNLSSFLPRLGVPPTYSLVPQDIKKVDFERLLSVFYPSDFLIPDLMTVEDWTSVLKLSERWGFNQLKRLAVLRITPIASAVEKIVLSKQFNVPDNEWLLHAYRELCMQASPVTPAEGTLLGMDVVIKIWEVQTTFRDISAYRHAYSDRKIVEMIKEKFGLV